MGSISTNTEAIIWADDDRYLLDSVFSALEGEGYEIIHAGSASETLSTVRKHGEHASLVVLDVMMPSGEDWEWADTQAGYRSGLALAKKLGKEYPELPILGCSAANDEYARDWFEEYTQGYIAKPINISDVLLLVDKIVNKKKRTRQARCFIVHGHDKKHLETLKNSSSPGLGLPNP